MSIRIFLIPPLLWLLALFVKRLFDLYQIRKRRTIHELSKMHRREFEFYVAQKLKSKWRKKVQVGKGIADGGWDIKATYKWKYYTIQCKCYKPSARIGVSKVRELAGILSSSPNHFWIICTPARFTKPAINLARKKRILLRLGNTLLHKIH